MAIDAPLIERIQQALSECADEARSVVMLKHFGDRGPTHEECRQVVGVDANGQPITRAMQLGVEQHQVALECAQEKLQELKPDGFSISPRYRIKSGTGSVQYLTQDQVKALLNAGRGAELRGTIEPDVVVHTGNPLQVQAIFDFKFPCVNGGEPPWRKYPDGPPHEGRDQGTVYKNILGTKPWRVVPRRGVLP
ncbi:MAG: hypothetical protein JXB05_22575 [Myxococcaceae bacterium]|nr:hypothetical protein [Myxococcaceae bacterium]